MIDKATDFTFYEEEKAFINGKIYTVNEKQPIVEAVLIRGNKIIFTGSSFDAEKMFTPKTEIIDLNGKLMLPGFIDAHAHFINGGFYILGLDLHPAKSTKDFTRILKKYVESNKNSWITGGNWDHEAWEKKDLPAKEMIDPFTPETPVFINRLDAHMGLANSYALKLAGIDKDTKNPEGGTIVKDPITGEPTGILIDNAMQLIYSIVPQNTEKDNYKAGLAALDEARKNGITSVQDITYKNNLITYQQIEKEGKLTCRIYTRLPAADYKNLVDAGIQYDFGSEKLKLGSIKAFSDGSLGSSTAWFFEKYNQDITTFGLPTDIVTDGRLEKWALDADKNKLQICTHAIGDRANAFMLDLYEKVENINPKWDRRFRIEHAQHVRKSDIKRFAQINVIVSAQPHHCMDDGVWAEKRIGKERLKEIYSFKSFLDKGVKLCFGSDWPVAPLNAIMGIYAAVTRSTLDDKNPNGWIPEQKISVEDAIKCYTINNAYASFEENIKGSIEPGKLADLVVLSDDILSIDPVKIKDVKVDITIFNGSIIYKGGNNK
jgi:predicted amidohydrolase YtcJ